MEKEWRGDFTVSPLLLPLHVQRHRSGARFIGKPVRLSIDEIRGKTPAIRLSAKQVSLNMLSSVTNQAKVRFVLFRAGMAAQLLIKLMKRLIRDTDRKGFSILDNLRVHHAQKVKEWLHGRGEGIEVFYLRAYSPQLDPDEYWNCDPKAGVHGKAPARSWKELAKRISGELLQTSGS